MITPKNINFIFEETDNYLLISAEIKLNAGHAVNKNQLFGYQHKQDIVKHIKENLIKTLEKEIYGDIREQARKTFVEVKNFTRNSPYFDFDEWKQVEEAFAPLLNAGIHDAPENN